MLNGPTPSARTLAGMLRDARLRTRAFAEALKADQLLGPRVNEVNPPLWEIGHLGWFQERWCLRYLGSGRLKPSLLPNADALYDSSCVPHRTRWDLPLPDLHGTLGYLQRVLDQVLEDLDRGSPDPATAYFIHLAAFHEDMHNEALLSTSQILGYPSPPLSRLPLASTAAGPWPGEAEIRGGEFMLGAKLWDGFVFDNEKWSHPVNVRAFRMARSPVTHREFLAFVEDHGYVRREFWSATGWAWRERVQASAPVYWKRMAGEWRTRWFNQCIPLALDVPVIHVNWFEAEAYCRWAGRRLPTEAEWEMAAAAGPPTQDADGFARRPYPWGEASPDAGRANLYGSVGGLADVAAIPEGDSAWGCRQMVGNVWEWTQDTFMPYPGFVVDPYQDYSAPWFGSQKVLRGGCFATAPRLIRNTWRNFYTPDRRDVFAGFRTCAIE